MKAVGMGSALPRRMPFQPSRLAGIASPTVDLYFAFSCARWLAEGKVRRVSPTVLSAGETLLVFRHTAGLSRLPPHNRLIYIIDDDIRAGLWDRGLPLTYRAKLAALDLRAATALERRADVIVASGAVLAARLREQNPGKRVEILDPAWPIEQAHAPATSGAPARIALMMGSSHVRDAASLMPVLARTLSRHPDARLTVSANLNPPRGLVRHPRVNVLPCYDWIAYLDWLRQARFDIGLVPHFAAGRFNAARSASKLGEYAMTGATVLAPKSWGPGAKAANEGRCIVVDDGPDAWLNALDRLLDDRQGTTDMAMRNHAALMQCGYPATQRRFWSALLGIDWPDDSKG